MPNFVYQRDIPNPPNNPSADVGPMKDNTNSIDSIIAVDHYGFNDAKGGLHKQVQLPNLTVIPSGLIANEGTLYTKNLGESQLFYTQDTSGNEYQLTRVINSSAALFAKNTNNYNAVGTDYSGGWTFLPGGLLYQYGTFIHTAGIVGSSIAVLFPVSFSTASSIIVTVTPICKAGGTSTAHVVSLVNGSIATSGFTANYDTSTTAYVGFSWTAVGT